MCYDHGMDSLNYSLFLDKWFAENEKRRETFESMFVVPKRPWEAQKELTWSQIGNYFKP